MCLRLVSAVFVRPVVQRTMIVAPVVVPPGHRLNLLNRDLPVLRWRSAAVVRRRAVSAPSMRTAADSGLD